MSKKDGPIQKNIGLCGHSIKAVRRVKKMVWWCETCNTYVEHEKTVLVPRKGK